MTIEVEVEGRRYTRFPSAEVMCTLDVLENSFAFDAAAADSGGLPFRNGDAVKLFVDGERVLTGFIEVTRITSDKQSHKVSYVGRDRLADLHDSSIGKLGELVPPVSLKRAAQLVLRHIEGIVDLGTVAPTVSDLVTVRPTVPVFQLRPDQQQASIDVIDLAGTDKRPFSKSEMRAAAEPGMNCFDYLEGLARRRQVLLTSNGQGNLVISHSGRSSLQERKDRAARDARLLTIARREATGPTNPNADAVTEDVSEVIDEYMSRAPGRVVPGVEIVNRISGSGNVKSASVTLDEKGRFNRYIAESQLSMLALAETEVRPDLVSSQSGGATDPNIRRSRQLVITGESSTSAQEAKDRAAWEAKLRIARGRVAVYTLAGHRNQAGELWEPNTLVRVVDERADIADPLLVNRVRFMFDKDGSSTQVSLVEKDAYSLEIESSQFSGDFG